jgi:foldase protein PrsA
MKKRLLLLSFSLVICSSYAWRETVDKIVMRVNGINILKSDIEQPRIDKGGKPYSVDDMIETELLFQKAAERKLLPTSIDIEKQITSWKSMNNFNHMNEEQLSDRLKNEGFSLPKYKNQLGRILAVRNIKQLETSERVVVSSREIKDYFADNPQYSEEKYLVQTALIPICEVKSDNDLEDLSTRENIDWIDVDWIDKSDVSEKMAFISSMENGEVSKPVKTEDGYQLVKLVDKKEKKEKTLEESWVSIEKKLQEEKRGRFEREFIRELRDRASIVYV